VPGRDQYRAAEFIEAIPGSGGIISTIAARVGCAWDTAKRYIENYATVRQAYENECEKVTDLAEAVVIGEIKNRDVHTAKWYLMMKGRSRGYVQSQRNENENSGEVIVHVVYDRSDDDVDDGD